MALPRDVANEPGLLTVSQVAAWLNVHPNTVRRWSLQGILNAQRVGPRHDRRFYRSDVEHLLESRTRDVPI